MANLLVRDKFPIDGGFPQFIPIYQDCKKRYGEPMPFHFAEQDNPIGIEIEVEGYKSNKQIPSLWEFREDGSLKDEGIELVSKILSKELIDYSLWEFHLLLDEHNKKCGPVRWSHRTSIHVHVNLSDLPVGRLKWLIAYYALLEPLFFSMCDEKRQGNAFCFPLTSCPPQRLTPGKHWSKYCALNLGTSLVNFNTVEFRHMHGTENIELILKWLHMICDFTNYIRGNYVKTLSRDMNVFLETGKINFWDIFSDWPVPKRNVRALIYDNAKWVGVFLGEK